MKLRWPSPPAVALAAVPLALALALGPLDLRAAGYAAMRGAIAAHAMAASGSDVLVGSGVRVAYPPKYRADAELARIAARSALPTVERIVGAKPAGRIPILIETSTTALTEASGLPPGLEASGCYAHGVVYVLAPEVWLAGESRARMGRTFLEDGPVAHELTHAVLDRATSGNVPRWYTEGVAQLVDRAVTGYVLPRPPADRTRYSLTALEMRFDALPDQAQAYREALELVTRISRRTGPGGLARVDAALGRGTPFWQALEAARGPTRASLARALQDETSAEP